NTAETRALAVDETGAGSVTLDGLTEFDRAVLVVTNLSTADHDPDSPACSVTASFAYSMESVDHATPPTVTGVDPADLTVGESYDVWISGADFVSGVTVSFGSGITLASVDLVDPTSIAVHLSVDAAAELGPRDLVVTNPNGKSAT